MTSTRFREIGRTFDRVALTAFVGLLPAVTVGAPLLRWAAGRPLTWEGQVADAAPLPRDLAVSAPGASIEWTGAGTVTLDHPTTAVRLAALLPDTLLALAVCGAGLLLVGVYHRISTGRPFAPANPRALQYAGVIVLAAALTIQPLRSFANDRVMDAALAGGDRVHVYTFNFGWLALGLGLWTLAAAFHTGERLTRETEGLV